MVALAVFTTYVVMDTFVITRVYGEAADSGSGTEAALQADNDNTEGNGESTADRRMAAPRTMTERAGSTARAANTAKAAEDLRQEVRATAASTASRRAVLRQQSQKTASSTQHIAQAQAVRALPTATAMTTSR